jgi:AcrR family transcriptional regulator
MASVKRLTGETRTNDPDETRRNILEVATREFADKGLAGARIDEIAEKTNTSKRMIYYYFGGKDELYQAVLEKAYAGIGEREEMSDFNSLSAEDAMRSHIELSFDYHTSHPEFNRLVMNENIHHAEHLKHVEGIRDRNRYVTASMKAILDKGVSEGRFREGVDPVDLHMMISSLSFFTVSNRYTFSLIFSRDISSPEALAKRRSQIVDVILRWVRN